MYQVCTDYYVRRMYNSFIEWCCMLFECMYLASPKRENIKPIRSRAGAPFMTLPPSAATWPLPNLGNLSYLFPFVVTVDGTSYEQMIPGRVSSRPPFFSLPIKSTPPLHSPKTVEAEDPLPIRTGAVTRTRMTSFGPVAASAKHGRGYEAGEKEIFLFLESHPFYIISPLLRINTQ